MSDQSAFLREVVEILEQCGVAYMLSGSIASSFYGEPRATRDIDIVIDCDQQTLQQLLNEIEHRHWYVSHDAAKMALRERSMFNIIDSNTGWKADLIVRKQRQFSIREFERRTPQPILSDNRLPVSTVSPEDAILTKLEWHKDSSHDQQYKDAVSIALVESRNLDWEYLRYWANALNVNNLLERLRDEVAKT